MSVGVVSIATVTAVCASSSSVVLATATRPRDLCPADGWNSGAAGCWLTEVRERERDRNRLGFVNLDVSETRLGLSS